MSSMVEFRRYLGLPVMVQTAGFARVIGILDSTEGDCLRLKRSHIQSGDTDVGWSYHSSHDDGSPSGHPESIVPGHCVISLTCLADQDELSAAVAVGALLAHVDEPVTQTPPVRSLVATEDFFADRLTLEIGSALVPLCKSSSHFEAPNSLLERVMALRSGLTREIGFAIPRLRVRDNAALNANEYVIKVSVVEVGGGTAFPDRLFAVGSIAALSPLRGIADLNPITGGNGIWIERVHQSLAEELADVVISPIDLILAHLRKAVIEWAHRLLNYDDVTDLVARHSERTPGAMHDLIPAILEVPMLHRVLCRLLEERVSILAFSQIVSAAAAHQSDAVSFDDLIERVRREIGHLITGPLRDESLSLRVLALETNLIEQIEDAVGRFSTEVVEWTEAFVAVLRAAAEQTDSAAVVVGATQRSAVSQFIRSQLPSLSVLSRDEIPPGLRLRITNTISSADILEQCDEDGTLDEATEITTAVHARFES